VTFRKIITTTIAKLGPHNPLSRFVVNQRCQPFNATLTASGSFLALRSGNREMRLAPKHFIYAPYLAENFEQFFSGLVPTQSGGKLMLDYSRPGIVQTYARSGLQFEMPSFPEEESAIEEYFEWYRPQPGDTAFDVGAHCGVSTYHFSKLVGPTGRVVAFEPDPTNYALLVRNIARHKLENVTAHQVAIAGTNGTAEFNCEESMGSQLTRHASHALIGTVERVETVTLETAFKEWGTPRFCKVDIEGSELEVFGAARGFLKNTGCNFAVDTNHRVDGSFTSERIEAIFRECGYQSKTSDSGAKTTWAQPGSTT
jgi:FkbM family methyltransferase